MQFLDHRRTTWLRHDFRDVERHIYDEADIIGAEANLPACGVGIIQRVVPDVLIQIQIVFIPHRVSLQELTRRRARRHSKPAFIYARVLSLLKGDLALATSRIQLRDRRRPRSDTESMPPISPPCGGRGEQGRSTIRIARRVRTVLHVLGGAQLFSTHH